MFKLRSKHRHTGRLIVAWILGVYAAIIVFLNLPFMQRYMADKVASVLTEQLGTRVSIGSINVGLLNRVIVNDLEAEDQKGIVMLKVGRVSASIDLVRTIQGQISISSAQLFSATAVIYKDKSDSPLNIQYVIDAFSSNDNEESSPLNLRINTLLVRHTNIKYDIKDKETKQGKLDVNHIDAHKIGFNLSLKNLSEDSLNVSLKRFSAKEYNSGLYIAELAFKSEANKEHGEVNDLVLRLSSTSLSIPKIAFDYSRYKTDKILKLNDDLALNGQVGLSDLSCLVPKFEKFTSPYELHLLVSGNTDSIKVKYLTLADESNTLNLNMSAEVHNVLGDISVNGEINELSASNQGISNLLSSLSIDESSLAPVMNLGNIKMNSTVHYDKEDINVKGQLQTGIGDLIYSANFMDNKHLECTLNTFPSTNINLGKLLDNPDLGSLSITLDADVTFEDQLKYPNGTLNLNIPNFTYKGYQYSNIDLGIQSNNDAADIQLNIDDKNITLNADAMCSLGRKDAFLGLNMAVDRLNPHAMNLIDKYNDNVLSFKLKADINGSDINTANGTVAIQDLTLSIPDTIMKMDGIDIELVQETDGYSDLEVSCDFMKARIKGYGHLANITSDLKKILNSNLSEVIKSDNYKSDSQFEYDLTFHDSPFLHHFIPEEYNVDEPIHIIGSMDVAKSILNLDVDAPMFKYGEDTYKDITVTCCNNTGQLSVKASGLTHNSNSAIKIDLNAIAKNNVVDSDVKVKMRNQNDISMNLKSKVTFADSLGQLRTLVNIDKSDFVINDTVWDVKPAEISVYGKEISCHNLMVSSGDNYLTVEGKASPNPSDSIVAKLKNIDIEYVLNIVNFTAVDFSGVATGEATLFNLLGKPDFKAHLNVHDFCLEGGLLGNADIYGHWDNDVNGIGLEANIVNMYKHHDGLSDEQLDRFGTTKVKGFVSPAENDIYLHVDAMDTHAKVLEGFLGIVFNDMDGYMRGWVDVVGPLNKVDLVGEVTGQMSMTLKATNVPYMIQGDTIRLSRGHITFNDIHLYDKYNNVGVLNGEVTHSNLRNFAYTFDADARQMMIYDEKDFNASKFYATVFASGNMRIDGSDGHPIYISGDITTTKGSVFAYDNVSPDALVNSNFIEFRDVTQKEDKQEIVLFDRDLMEVYDPDDLSQYIEKKVKKTSDYSGDIYMDFHCNMNENCEVKLRMDRMEDAYITVYGNARLQAKWHNKGAFQLFGTYNVNRGKYRLYMHDLVYRDLSIQDGSAISFNGNPFDAGIHLICNHEIHNVPLSDLTATTAYSQNNKVKVVCVLDITGTVSNMDFKFDINLPNVSDEIRQLVRSMINSDEEMNTQMIYLLAVNRFYPNDFARANGDNKSGQAVNSFVSSTISGQINQMLSNIIGTNSNWNFGTGISTGEKGWQDMDVEGILSGRLFNDRLLLNGNFGYRDNAMTNTQSFIGDFELKWRLWQSGNTFLKAYNMTNDRYFTKGTLNTQGLGISFQHDFESFRSLLFGKHKNEKNDHNETQDKGVKEMQMTNQNDEVKNDEK